MPPLLPISGYNTGYTYLGFRKLTGGGHNNEQTSKHYLFMGSMTYVGICY